MTTTSGKTTQILWLRNDLRLHDHDGFKLAVENGSPLAVIYILPEHWLTEDAHGMSRLGGAKARFLRAALIDLHRQLEDQTINFHMFRGEPVDIFKRLRDEIVGDIRLLTSIPQAPEERDWLTKLEEADFDLVTYESQTLFTQDQMSTLLTNFPGSFSKFRRTVEKNNGAFTVAESQAAVPLHIHEQPLRTNAAISWPSSDYQVEMLFHGGERPGLDWLNRYIWEEKAISHYKDTRNALTGEFGSSHFSPWLAWGCLSPRQIWHEILKYEASYGETEQTYWLRFELLWREYFHWSMHAHSERLFIRSGIQRKPQKDSIKVSTRDHHWQAWCQATTGVPMIDAGLRELRSTGFVSNRLRQNMASYFIHQLKLDWRLGARWFEMHLCDFDVASNYGNWAYLAGVGHDPRPVREFNLNKQLHQYDPELVHIRQWCPEISEASLQEILNHQSGRKTLASFPSPVVTTAAYDVR